MKKVILIVVFVLLKWNVVISQTCDDLIEYVKSKSYGTTYTSYSSKAISKVTFYTTLIDYQTYYFAIVCFKPNEYSYNCREYIYQVGFNTQTNYALEYYNGAGEAFWKYIQPYSDVLDCSPD